MCASSEPMSAPWDCAENLWEDIECERILACGSNTRRVATGGGVSVNCDLGIWRDCAWKGANALSPEILLALVVAAEMPAPTVAADPATDPCEVGQAPLASANTKYLHGNSEAALATPAGSLCFSWGAVVAVAVTVPVPVTGT